MKILIIKTSSMGDVIHALPAITDAAKTIPNLTIDWVVESNFAEIPTWHPAVRRVIPCAIRQWRKNIFKTFFSPAWKDFYSLLRSEHYDYIIDLQGLLKSAWINLFAHGISCGYDKSSVREKLASIFYKNKFFVSKNLHAIERNRLLLSQVLHYSFDNTIIDYGLNTQTRLHKNYWMFIVNTTAEKKYWKIDSWKALLSFAEKRQKTVLIPAGVSPKEHEHVNIIVKDHANAKILFSKNLTELKEKIEEASLVISVDTGLSHLAAALDKKNIVLYLATDPKKIGTCGKDQCHLTPEQGNISVELVEKTLKDIS